jgi:hypothetical protein
LVLTPKISLLLDAIERRVAEDRGGRTENASERRLVTREEFAVILEAQFDEADETEIAASQEVMVLLGLLDEGEDLKALNVAHSQAQVLGQFDPESGELYVLVEGGDIGLLEEFVYAHEFSHALQQSRFDLKSMMEATEDDSEARFALRSLFEGDATLSSGRYAGQYLDQQETIRQAQEIDALTPDVPRVIEESSAFPYREGLSFVLFLFGEGGWEAVNGAYADPPTTAEQIMHPSKYSEREPPIAVDLPDVAGALGEGWEEMDVDVLGEFFFKLVLEEQISTRRASRAAAGWGGDRYALLRGPGSSSLFVNLARWDTERDAEEFYDAYVRLLEERDIELDETDSVATGSFEGKRYHIAVDGVVTLLIISRDAAAVDRVTPLFGLDS